LAIHHVTKSAVSEFGGSVKPLTVHSGKGSSALEQKADKVICIEGLQTKTRRVVRSLKARDETPFKYYADVCMDTFVFADLDPADVVKGPLTTQKGTP
jgi:hypothetical protein